MYSKETMTPTDITWLHVELSSRCNAWCPVCRRNKDGYGIADDLIEQDLHTSRLLEVFSQLSNLTTVQLCGNLGDPVIANNFLEVVDECVQRNFKIQVHTNGSLRNTQWWSQLGIKLQDHAHDIWFGLDGLADVHEVYRQGTSYNKIIENATAFINAGGQATWQFIPYAHNEHQLMDAMRTSQHLGFKKFHVMRLNRPKKLVRHWKTGETFELLPSPKLYEHLQKQGAGKVVDLNNCMHVSIPSIYLAANGKISTCCYFSEHQAVDNVTELFYNTLDLTHPQCIKSCGT